MQCDPNFLKLLILALSGNIKKLAANNF